MTRNISRSIERLLAVKADTMAVKTSAVPELRTIVMLQIRVLCFLGRVVVAVDDLVQVDHELVDHRAKPVEVDDALPSSPMSTIWGDRWKPDCIPLHFFGRRVLDDLRAQVGRL
jgi:hypothetical protein